MAKKAPRRIVAPVSFGDKLYKPGMEDDLAAVAPQWNLRDMQQKEWIAGDWSGEGLTPEEEAEAVEEAQEKAAKGGKK